MIPNFFRYFIDQSINGVLLIGISGFGMESVIGRNLVPRPPDNIIASIKNVNHKLN